MPVISPRTLIPRIQSGDVIRYLSDRDRNKPEGAGFDLRLGQVHRLTSDGSLGQSMRRTSQLEALEPTRTDDGYWFSLLPQQYVLVTTTEEVALDEEMVGFVHPRTTLFRSGAILSTGVVSPGYRGQLTFGCYVAGSHPFDVELEARIAHINFLELDQGGESYRGQWQGGRISADYDEEQI